MWVQIQRPRYLLLAGHYPNKIWKHETVRAVFLYTDDSGFVLGKYYQMPICYLFVDWFNVNTVLTPYEFKTYILKLPYLTKGIFFIGKRFRYIEKKLWCSTYFYLYPYFRIRSWNNGVHCMSLYIPMCITSRNIIVPYFIFDLVSPLK